MIPLRVTALIDAPEGAVRRVLARTDIWTRTARALGARADLCGGQPGERAALQTGDLIRFRSDRTRPGWAGTLLPARSLILSIISRNGLPHFELVAGPPSFLRIAVTVVSTGAGTLVTADCQLEMHPRPLTWFYRLRVLAAGQLLLGIVRLAAAEIQVVVAGAIIEDGRVLAARRTHPPELAGKWELPGGKVLPGESEAAALTRELAEELDVEVVVGDRIGTDVVLGDHRVLRCRGAVIAAGRPDPNEHDVIRWLDAAELDELDWLPADRELVPVLRRILEKI